MSDESLRRHLDATGKPSPDQDLELDLRGQMCPACLLLALKELNRCAGQVRAGAVLRILTDDRQATTTIPVMVQRMGFRAGVERVGPGGQGGQGYRISIDGHA